MSISLSYLLGLDGLDAMVKLTGCCCSLMMKGVVVLSFFVNGVETFNIEIYMSDSIGLFMNFSVLN